MNSVSKVKFYRHVELDPILFIHEGRVTLTAEQAAVILSECRYENQRDETKAPAHIRKLAKMMTEGLWLEGTAIDFAYLNGKYILVNGHHRMMAQSISGTTIEWTIIVHNCTTVEQVRGLYYRFDTDIRKRSSENVLAGIGFAEEHGLMKRTATALWDSVRVIHNGMNFRVLTDQDDILADKRIEMSEQFLDEARFMEEVVNAAIPSMRERFITSSIFSVAILTLFYDRSKAEDFWMGAAKDDGLRAGDPRKTMIQWIAANRGVKKVQKSAMICAARCWNSWHDGKKLNSLRIYHNAEATPIKGTPYVIEVLS